MFQVTNIFRTFYHLERTQGHSSREDSPKILFSFKGKGSGSGKYSYILFMLERKFKKDNFVFIQG